MSKSKPKAKRVARSGSKGTTVKKASGTSRSKASSSSSTRRSPSRAKDVTALRPSPRGPVEGSLHFFVNTKEATAGEAWIAEHKRSKCRLAAPLFTWCFTPMQRRGEDTSFAIAVRCECGGCQYLTKAPPEVLSKMMKDIAATTGRITAPPAPGAADPFAAFSARAAAKTSGAARGRDERAKPARVGSSKSSPRAAG